MAFVSMIFVMFIIAKCPVAIAQSDNFTRITKFFTVDPKQPGHLIPRGSIVRQMKNGITQITDSSNHSILNARDDDATLLTVPRGPMKATHVFQIPNGAKIRHKDNITKIYDGDALVLTVINDNQQITTPSTGSLVETFSSDPLTSPVDLFSANWIVPSSPCNQTSTNFLHYSGGHEAAAVRRSLGTLLSQ